jgi:hypothetical protein
MSEKGEGLYKVIDQDSTLLLEIEDMCETYDELINEHRQIVREYKDMCSEKYPEYLINRTLWEKFIGEKPSETQYINHEMKYTFYTSDQPPSSLWYSSERIDTVEKIIEYVGVMKYLLKKNTLTGGGKLHIGDSYVHRFTYLISNLEDNTELFHSFRNFVAEG